MIVARALPAATANDCAEDFDNDVGAFLSVLAELLVDNALRLEETAGRVTDLVMSSGRPDRELIVALQTFDRLKQEFEAFGDALARYAEGTATLPLVGRERAKLGQDVIAAIKVGDLKDRLSCRMQSNQLTSGEPYIPYTATPDAGEVNVDVVF